MYIELLLLFVLTVFSSLAGNLKYLLIANEKSKIKYLIVFLDTFIFGYTIKVISTTDSLLSMSVYTMAKMVGLLLTDVINKKMLNKTYLINLYLHEDKADIVQNLLKEHNISFTKIRGDFMGSLRVILTLHLSKKQYATTFVNILKTSGIENPTMDISEVEVRGNIERRI